MKNRWCSRWVGVLVSVVVAGVLMGCASAPREIAIEPGADATAAAWSQLKSGDAPWHHQSFPGKTPTHFGYTRVDGRDAMAATAHASASMLRRKVQIQPADIGKVRFSWKVPELIADADMAVRDFDDAPVRLVLAFDGDRSKFSARNSMLSELARTLTGEEMPYATLMYVWCTKRAPGTVIVNPRTDRIRKLVVESGPGHLNRWMDYERDIRADFEKAFGEPPGALIGVGIMTDADNTQSHASAWYGPVKLLAADRAP